MQQTEIIFIPKMQQQRPVFTEDNAIINWKISTKDKLNSWFSDGYTIKEQIDFGDFVCLIFELKEIQDDRR